MSQRDYNRVYTVGRFILQIMQDGQHGGLVVGLTPSVTLAINGSKCVFALGFYWIMGTVNFGFMSRAFATAEKERRQRVVREAARAGLTPEQYALRWGW